MAKSSSTPGIARKYRNTGCTGRTWVTAITSAMTGHLLLKTFFSPAYSTQTSPRNVFENPGANQQRRQKRQHDGPGIERELPPQTISYRGHASTCVWICAHRHAPLSRAFAAAKFERKGFRIAPIQENVLNRLRHFGKRMQALDDRFVGCACHPRVEGLAPLAILLIKGEEFADDRRDWTRWHGHDLTREANALGIHAATEKELVVRRLLFLDLPNIPIEADVGNVVLTAGARAAANFDAELFDFGIVVAFESAGKLIGQCQRARDAEVAGSGSGAAGDVGNRARAGNGEVKGPKIIVNRARAVERNPGNHQVLIDGDAHAGEIVFLQEVREAAHLPAIKSPRGKLDPNGVVAGLALRHQVVFGPAVVPGIGPRICQTERQGRGRDVDQRGPDRRRHGEDFGGRL